MTTEVRFCSRGPLLTGPQKLHTGVEKLKKPSFSLPPDLSISDQVPPSNSINENVFLIDWLTVVFKDMTVYQVMQLLGLERGNIPWEQRHNFVYGYPVTTFWNNICIRWGADREEYYQDDEEKSAAQKVRTDMGVCLEMSGQGCRAFETYGNGDWIQLFRRISESGNLASVTRLDLAYDDHIGYLNINRIEQDARDRNLVCKGRRVRGIWSDDWDEDVQGLTVEVGSKKSSVLIRIYDKAAERGYDHSMHWIRVEIQLRKERALCAVLEILAEDHVGYVASGILRNYCTFRTPTADSNKCRWPIADYWEKIMLNMEKIRLVITPGEEYNFSKTEQHMKLQYGQAFIAYYRMHGDLHQFLREVLDMYPVLKPKYENAINDFKLMEAECKRRRDEQRRFYGFEFLDEDDPLCQVDFVELFGDDCLPLGGDDFG